MNIERSAPEEPIYSPQEESVPRELPPGELSSPDVGTLSPEQIRVIGLSRKIAPLITDDLGQEIVEDYITHGLSYHEIVDKRDIKDRYGLTSDSVAIRAVWEVIGELVDEETRQTVAQQHWIASGEKYGPIGGQTTYQEGKGIFGLSSERKKEIASYAGSLGGKKIRTEKIGIFSYSADQTRANSLKGTEAARRKNAGYFGMTPEQRREAGYLAAAARGQFVWKDEEIERLQELLLDPGYKTRRGGVDYDKIAQVLNQEFSHDRSPSAVETRVLKLKRSGSKIVDFSSIPPGQYLWTAEETERLFMLSNDPAYKTKRGAIDYKKIAYALNQKHGHNRTEHAVSSMLRLKRTD